MTPSEQSDSRLNRATSGMVWRHKRDRHRTVTITGLYSRGMERYVGVVRNTSRRTQGIKESTLLRDYEFAHERRS
jgi:hypothetical protein